ncbi:MAG TPA: hypothetical protein PKM27_04145 [Saprospiraceae bacterium]|nr:hypothetical protein [Saprospiraceae bacterium]HNT20485.1 hypothetical protein [Saprospiraceae bacterium]
MNSLGILSFSETAAGFIDHSLDKSRWTHEAHITTAIWFLLNYEKQEALCRLRSGIISYNLATGGENTGSSGYHETITVFWWTLLERFVQANPGKDYDQLCRAFLNSRYAHRETPFEFYSREKLLSARARAYYLAPDIKEIHL